jgi:hypothetical protein
VAATRARENEIDDIRGTVSVAEEQSNSLRQRLQVSGSELRRSEDALRSAQRQNRSLTQRLDAAEAQMACLQEALKALDTQKDVAQVCCASHPSHGIAGEVRLVMVPLVMFEHYLATAPETETLLSSMSCNLFLFRAGCGVVGLISLIVAIYCGCH